MAIGLLGRKIGMTQVFNDKGEAVSVTLIEVGPCRVLQLRTKEKDGYEAVQIGFADKPRRLASRSERGHVAKLDSKRGKKRGQAGGDAGAKANCEPQRLVREFRSTLEGYTIGQTLTVEMFKDVKAVDVIGTTKGRGTTGVMKRHNFGGQRATHGVKKVHRHGGSNGQNTFPAHVFKGKKMAGQYGNERSTMRNIKIERVETDHNLLLVHGAVPGPIGGYVMVRKTNKFAKLGGKAAVARGAAKKKG